MPPQSPAQSQSPKPFIFRHGRKTLYAISALIALLVWAGVSLAYPPGDLRYIRLEEWYGFIAIVYLYLALLPSPLYFVFPQAPRRGQFLYLRRALGISTFVFALLHSIIAYTKVLQGSFGISFLETSDKVTIALAALALFILFLMAATSFDYFFVKMGKWWGFLHRFVYLAGAIIILHVMLIGAVFSDATSLVPLVFFTLIFLLLVLQMFRLAVLFAKWLRRPGWASGIRTVLIIGLCLLFGYVLFISHFGHHHHENTSSIPA